MPAPQDTIMCDARNCHVMRPVLEMVRKGNRYYCPTHADLLSTDR
jgi:hypothetical protein